MPEKKLFSDPRWNDTSIPKTVGHREVTPEEKAQSDKRMAERIARIKAKRKLAQDNKE